MMRFNLMRSGLFLALNYGICMCRSRAFSPTPSSSLSSPNFYPTNLIFFHPGLKSWNLRLFSSHCSYRSSRLCWSKASRSMKPSSFLTWILTYCCLTFQCTLPWRPFWVQSLLSTQSPSQVPSPQEAYVISSSIYNNESVKFHSPHNSCDTI